MKTMEMEKRYCLILFFPVVFFVIYVTSDLHHWFSFSSLAQPGFKQKEMMQAELKSVALLQKQAAGLLRILDVTSNSSDGETFRGEILSQLRLNSEVQQMLLSIHSNGSTVASGSNRDSAPGAASGFSCKVVDGRKYKKRDGLRWKAKANRYLFAVCTSGQISNHLLCIEKHMFFAALLDRTLVLPSPSVDYHYERVLNVSHMQNCLGGKNTVITFEDFKTRRKGKLHVNRFLCYMHDCYLDAEHEKKLRGLGVLWGKKEDAWPKEANLKIPHHPHASEFVQKFSTSDEVIGIGDVFYADVEAEWVKQPGGPLAHTCQSIIQPHNFIMATAQRFVQTFLGKNYIALHFRRYGFLTFCNENSKKGEKCFFYPIPQAAECILWTIQSSTAPVIYLSTDAKESEIGLLQRLLIRNGVTIPLVQRPNHDRGEKWDSPLLRHGLVTDSEVIAMLDKTICAMASLFIGTQGSTFSDDIIRMRGEWGTSNTCDKYLCEAGKPNFIADLY